MGSAHAAMVFGAVLTRVPRGAQHPVWKFLNIAKLIRAPSGDARWGLRHNDRFTQNDLIPIQRDVECDRRIRGLGLA